MHRGSCQPHLHTGNLTVLWELSWAQPAGTWSCAILCHPMPQVGCASLHSQLHPRPELPRPSTSCALGLSPGEKGEKPKGSSSTSHASNVLVLQWLLRANSPLGSHGCCLALAWEYLWTSWNCNMWTSLYHSEQWLQCRQIWTRASPQAALTPPTRAHKPSHCL